MRHLGACMLACVVLLVAATTAGGAPKASLSDIEDEVMCLTCGTALSLSESPFAERMRAFIQRLIDDGRSKEEIKKRLVDEFGPEVLATPPREGFSIAAYVVPVAAFALAAISIALALMRRRGPPPRSDPTPVGDEFEELVDADLAGFRGRGLA
jgi:cytochrome c-type biogenesis protein CcmH